MKITARLAADLRLLTAALDQPDVDIAHSLDRFAALARAAVPTFLGMKVSRSDPLFTFDYPTDCVRADHIATSLRTTLNDVDGSVAPTAISLTLYAGTPGAFVDLAADLAWLTARPLSDFALDQHLTIDDGSAIGTPLAAASVINQAIGVLIGRGYTPEQANHRIDAEAAHAGNDRHAAAQLIITTHAAGDVGPRLGEVQQHPGDG